MCTGCSAHLCWGGELKGWWTHSPHLQPQQGTAAEEMGQSGHSEQKSQRMSLQGNSLGEQDINFQLALHHSSTNQGS